MIPASAIDTVWVLGDQLNRSIGPLADRKPGECRVLMVESEHKTNAKPWHVQRLFVVISAMRHFAEELRAEGFEVDYRQASTLQAGLREHIEEFGVDRVFAMEPMSWDGRAMLERLGVEMDRNDQFLCHYDDFAAWAEGRKSLKLEDFYRWQRVRLDVLMTPGGKGPTPTGDRWNFDHDNRERPPKDGRAWPEITHFGLDAIDRQVLDELGERYWGEAPQGQWPVTRAQALQRLDDFVSAALGPFGPFEDAMLAAEWKMAHSTLACSLNIGLLHPQEVTDAVVDAYETSGAPINSVEGFVRQVIGWREYVWGLYWLWMPDYRHVNGLNADLPVPPVFRGEARTELACVSATIDHLHANAYTHHIERLMVLGNLALTLGVNPQEMTEWMWASFVDAAEWVMVPNVLGMALHADGGQMATKPYASGGAYLNKMSDFCRTCRFDPKKRVGDDACPFTSLYWDFLARNEPALSNNHRMGQQLAGMRRLANLAEVRERASEVRALITAGEL